MGKVYSKQDHVRWYHWLLLTIEAAFLLAMAGACLWCLYGIAVSWSDSRVVGQALHILLQAGIVLPLIGAKFIYSVRHIFFQQLVLEYDDTGLQSFQGTFLNQPGAWKKPIPFADIANIEVSYNDTILFRLKTPPFPLPANAISDQIKIVGSDQALDQFVKFAGAHGVAVQNTNFTGDDQGHQLGIAVLIIMGLVGLYIGALVLVHFSLVHHS